MKHLTIIPLLVATLYAQSPAISYHDAVAADQKASKNSTEKWPAAPHKYRDLIKAPVTLIPYPRQAQWSDGKIFDLPRTLPIFLDGEQALSAYESLSRALKNKGVKLNGTHNSRAKLASHILIDAKKVDKAEGYQLTITHSSIQIEAHDSAGAFYAVQTLKQMLRHEDEKTTLPVCNISDYPAFKIRGFMHDTGRNFQTIDALKNQIDRFASYKLNTFHWHLTDNPAWRIESKAYPQLNDPKNRRKGRDENSTYTYDQIREVIAYAKLRHVMIIPELDMPGHSEYFKNTFGFKMGHPKSIPILEKLIDEFCAEIPASDCPYLHLGADEVHIPDPDAFIKRMSAKVRANKRTPILWNPGLKPTDDQTVTQLWKDQDYSGDIKKSNNPIIDSAGGYINSVDPQRMVQRYFFWQACKRPAGDAQALGSIICCWPDVNVNDKQNIFKHNGVWPSILVFSETIWQGRSQPKKRLIKNTPDRGTEAWLYLREFEARLCDHRDRYFTGEHFPYVKQTGIEWDVSNVYPHAKGDPWSVAFTPETKPNDPSIKWRPFNGGTFILPGWKQVIPSTRYVRTYLHAKSDCTTHLMIGFDTPGRANRRSPGIPKQGQWDANGGTVFLNGKELTAPVWKQPGMFRYEYRTWHKPPNEIPYTDEEFYWSREHVKVQLKKGPNAVLIRVPYVHKLQSYQATCIPVKKHNGRWIEDESIKSTRNIGLSQK